jgi:dipeptidyl aminopeptidase/acylaminoacyl peptidase
VVVADATTGAVVGRVGGRCIAVQQPRFGAHGRLGLVSDATGWPVVHVTDATATRPPEPVVDEPHEHATAAWGPGQRSWCWSPDGTAIAWCRNEAGHGRLCVADVATAEGAAVTELARGWHGGLDWSPAGLVAVRSGARTPTQLVTYALPGGERCVRAHGPVAGVRALELVEPEPVSWTADDGARIPGRLYHPPAGEVAGLLVWIHGGPTGQWPVEWNARIAAWVSRGWGVLVPDHRGSTGWGRAFQQALNGSWGVLDAEDVAAGAAVARRAGWSGAGPVVGLGGSAGGFTVLNVLVRRPGALDAAVVAYPVTDLVALDDTTHRFEAHANATLVGPRPEHEHRFRDRSPLAHAGRITVPVLVFHGRDDVVVPVAQSQALVAAVQAAGGDAELVVYDGEGHGWSRPATGADELARTEAFLARMQARGR